ncbi:estrogen-responsive protein Fam102A/B [Metarhizium guizhouense ARSEF 977]|uniref:Estrogen-responsive protein Fam102A/B n=1 Tax=Metarhizium guizhouense (strain ARSEF 977) TaxID=1276136 RepID=A0A0B4HBE8_METGA|nr:estrogen-responsive protein Fam102A/B [Metarhizium guizhouense ARSEF 977]
MHAEHRGRTGKCPISNHKVDYGYSKLIPGVRISMEKNNSLTECPMEFEIVQEFAVAEKITLGYVKLNLAEYVEESESFSREAGSPPRKRSSIGVSPTPADGGAGPENRIVEEGIVRRYLMSDSKINSTLKIGILMVQVDGERNFVAPALKTAPVFGGIAGLVAPEAEDDTSRTLLPPPFPPFPPAMSLAANAASAMPSISKPRDAAEVHDLYRRTLAASWSRQPNELPADECIEDIFSGGNGWGTKKEAHDNHNSDEGEAEPLAGTLRPSDFRRYANHHNSHDGSHSRHSRSKSASSDRSVSTVTGGSGGNSTGGHRRGGRFVNEDGRDARDDDLGSSRSGSMGSLAPTLGSSSDGGRGEPVMRRAREVDEFEVREDLVAWKLPGSVEA